MQKRALAEGRKLRTALREKQGEVIKAELALAAATRSAATSEKARREERDSWKWRIREQQATLERQRAHLDEQKAQLEVGKQQLAEARSEIKILRGRAKQCNKAHQGSSRVHEQEHGHQSHSSNGHRGCEHGSGAYSRRGYSSRTTGARRGWSHDGSSHCDWLRLVTGVPAARAFS